MFDFTVITKLDWVNYVRITNNKIYNLMLDKHQNMMYNIDV